MDKWTVSLHRKARKSIDGLPKPVREQLFALLREIEISGPMRSRWKNFGKLSKTKYHCHIKSGKPTYVVCWEVADKKIKIIEVYYVGTHEKAPY